MANTTPIIGYSPNDFFYNKADVCRLDEAGSFKDTSNDESNDESNGVTGYKTACDTNKKLAHELEKQTNYATTTSAKYEYTKIMYNRELLRTFNYLAGIGALAYYIYVNNQ